MTNSQPSTKEWIQSLTEPALLLAMAMKSYVQVCLETTFLRGDPLALLLRTEKLRDEAFGRFWVGFSTLPTTIPAPEAEPEPQGSAALIPPILTKATGTVLDVGPGTGTQMPLLNTSPQNANMKSIYGAEPCTGLHAELRKRARMEGLEGKYHVLGCGVEMGGLEPEMRRVGLLRPGARSEGVFDTIICIRVLCSVPDLETRTEELYTLLRPGGRLLVVEHVVNPWRTAKGSIVARLVQAVYGVFGWSWFMGNCCLNRDTEGALRKAAENDGGWDVVDIERSFGWSPLAYISGAFVKRLKTDT